MALRSFEVEIFSTFFTQRVAQKSVPGGFSQTSGKRKNVKQIDLFTVPGYQSNCSRMHIVFICCRRCFYLLQPVDANLFYFKISLSEKNILQQKNVEHEKTIFFRSKFFLMKFLNFFFIKFLESTCSMSNRHSRIKKKAFPTITEAGKLVKFETFLQSSGKTGPNSANLNQFQFMFNFNFSEVGKTTLPI